MPRAVTTSMLSGCSFIAASRSWVASSPLPICSRLRPIWISALSFSGRRCRHLRIGIVGTLGLLHPVERVGEGQAGKGVFGGEIECKAKIDHGGQLVALGRSCRAEPVEHLAGALLSGVDEAGQRLACLQLVEGVTHDRVARQQLIEGGIGLDGEVRTAGLRFEPGIGIDDAQGILVGVVSGLEPALRFRLIADEVGDQPGMEVAESVVGALALQLVHHFERALSVIGTGIGPSGQEGAGEIGCSTPSAAGEVLAGLRELAGLDLANPKAELREAVRSIAGGEALGRRGRRLAVLRPREATRRRARAVPPCAGPLSRPRGRSWRRRRCPWTRRRYRRTGSCPPATPPARTPSPEPIPGAGRPGP